MNWLKSRLMQPPREWSNTWNMPLAALMKKVAARNSLMSSAPRRVGSYATNSASNATASNVKPAWRQRWTWEAKSSLGQLGNRAAPLRSLSTVEQAGQGKQGRAAQVSAGWSGSGVGRRRACVSQRLKDGLPRRVRAALGSDELLEAGLRLQDEEVQLVELVKVDSTLARFVERSAAHQQRSSPPETRLHGSTSMV